MKNNDELAELNAIMRLGLDLRLPAGTSFVTGRDNEIGTILFTATRKLPYPYTCLIQEIHPRLGIIKTHELVVEIEAIHEITRLPDNLTWKDLKLWEHYAHDSR